MSGLDEHLGRHPRNDPDAVDTRDLRVPHADLRRVVGLVGALVEQTIGRDVRDRAMQRRNAALIVGQETDVGLSPGRTTSMSSGLTRAVTIRRSCRGTRSMQRRAGADDATGGMNPQVGYHAVFGRLDRRSQQLIVGRLQSFANLKNLVLRLAQRLRDLVLTVVLELEETLPAIR